MAAQMANSTNKLTTVRFKLPDNLVPNIQRMYILGQDILIYTDRPDQLTTDFSTIGFTKVERKYQLHVSSTNEDTFKKVFSADNLTYDARPISNGRFIATVTVDTLEEFTRYLELDDQGNGCRIKPYKQRYASARDDSSDANEEDHADQYQRHPQAAENTNQYKSKGGKGKGKGYGNSYGRGGGAGGAGGAGGGGGKGYKGGNSQRRENTGTRENKDTNDI